MKFLHPIHSIFAGISMLVRCSPDLQSAPVLFTVDEAQSQITLAGSVIGNKLVEQGPGSLATHFSGTIKADVSASQIQFSGGSTLIARTNGVWTPGPGGTSGSAPADYGAQASTFLGTVKGALRNLVLDLTSEVLPLNNGQLDGSALRFGFPTNSTAAFDYDAGFLGSATIKLSGISTNKIVNGATLATVGDSQTLTIQVDTEFKFKAVVDNDSSAHLTGKLVATQTTPFAITSIVVKNQTVTLEVQGAGAAPQLVSSTNLTQWTARTPTVTLQNGGATLTVPVGGAAEFYRAVK